MADALGDIPADTTHLYPPRSRGQRIGFAFLVVLALAVVADYAGLFGYRGNDFANFDGKPIRVVRVIDGETIVVTPVSGMSETIVHLLGVAAPASAGAATTQAAGAADSYIRSRLLGKDAVLTLPPTETRDAKGSLLAYVYLQTECVNQSLISAGYAYADRRTKHPFHGAFEDAENDARLKKRSMWADLRFEDQPEWRQQWLRSKSRTTKPSH